MEGPWEIKLWLLPLQDAKGAWLCSVPGLSLTHSALEEAALTMVSGSSGWEASGYLQEQGFLISFSEYFVPNYGFCEGYKINLTKTRSFSCI